MTLSSCWMAAGRIFGKVCLSSAVDQCSTQGGTVGNVEPITPYNSLKHQRRWSHMMDCFAHSVDPRNKSSVKMSSFSGSRWPSRISRFRELRAVWCAGLRRMIQVVVAVISRIFEERCQGRLVAARYRAQRIFFGIPKFPSTRRNGKSWDGFGAPDGTSVNSHSLSPPGKISIDVLGSSTHRSITVCIPDILGHTMGPARCQIACKQVLSIQTSFIHLNGRGWVDGWVQNPWAIICCCFLERLPVNQHFLHEVHALVYVVLWLWKPKVIQRTTYSPTALLSSVRP